MTTFFFFISLKIIYILIEHTSLDCKMQSAGVIFSREARGLHTPVVVRAFFVSVLSITLRFHSHSRPFLRQLARVFLTQTKIQAVLQSNTSHPTSRQNVTMNCFPFDTDTSHTVVWTIIMQCSFITNEPLGINIDKTHHLLLGSSLHHNKLDQSFP